MRWIALALPLVLGACDTLVDPQLIPVRRITPAAIEPGVELEVIGAGFPAGRDAVVRFAGVFHRPGQPPLDVSVSARGRAVASDRVELVVGERLVSRLGGRGTFRGDVRVTFAGADADARVHGLL